MNIKFYRKFIIIFILTNIIILNSTNAFSAAVIKYVFTVNADYTLPKNERCRPLENFSYSHIKQYCVDRSKAVMFCSTNNEEYYLIGFYDKGSCSETLRIVQEIDNK